MENQIDSVMTHWLYGILCDVFVWTLSCVAYAFYIGDQLDKGEMSKLPLVENGPLEEIQMEKTV